MKAIKSVISVAIVAIAVLLSSTPADAQIKFGIKAGANFNSLKFNQDLFNDDNRAGFNGGVMLEFTMPLIGVGMDASVMYVHRSGEDFKELDASGNEISTSTGRDYIDIPLNLKYKLSLPGIGSLVKPFVTTGPSFAFLVSKKNINEFIKNKSCDIAWNFGFGVELFSHVQVAASYGLGLTNTLEYVGIGNNNETIEGKNRYWTVTAAYLF